MALLERDDWRGALRSGEGQRDAPDEEDGEDGRSAGTARPANDNEEESRNGTIRARAGEMRSMAAGIKTPSESGSIEEEGQVWMSTPARNTSGGAVGSTTPGSGPRTWLAPLSNRSRRSQRAGSDRDGSDSSDTESGLGVRRGLLQLDSLVLPSMSSSSSSSASSYKRRRVAVQAAKPSLLQASLPPSGGRSFSDEEFEDEFQTVSGKAAVMGLSAAGRGEEGALRRTGGQRPSTSPDPAAATDTAPSVAGSTLVNSDDQPASATNSVVSSASKSRRKPSLSSSFRAHSPASTVKGSHPISAFELDLPPRGALRNLASTTGSASHMSSPTLTASSTLPSTLR